MRARSEVIQKFESPKSPNLHQILGFWSGRMYVRSAVVEEGWASLIQRVRARKRGDPETVSSRRRVRGNKYGQTAIRAKLTAIFYAQHCMIHVCLPTNRCTLEDAFVVMFQISTCNLERRTLE